MMTSPDRLNHTLKLRGMLHRRTYSENELTVISGNDPHYSSKSGLDDALLEQRAVIVIKDPKLGQKSVLWINLGRYLDRTTLFTALGSLICTADVNHSILKFGKPLAIVSLVSHIGYQLLWSPNPLMRYR